MPKVTYIQSDQTEHVVEANAGDSVMQTAVDNGIPGIDADCGGGMACATCHIYVDEKWLGSVPGTDVMEDLMLDCVAAERNSNSRLSCQIDISDELDGLVVRIPASQH
jgi:2Fe-2S ferredoxin